MSILFKLRSLRSISPENIFNPQASKSQKFQALIHSTPSTLRKREKTQPTQASKTSTETTQNASIFAQITEIIGIQQHSLSPDKNDFFGISHVQTENPKPTEQEPKCSSGVCTIAEQSTHVGVPETSTLEDSEVNDVSPIVHKITEIVRAENGALSMEERLGREAFVFDSEIVEKVLKRCFKVGNLALRFFNWLKYEKGFLHTTETYNTMIYIAGEAKEFDVVEELVEQMEKESSVKNIKTWTILISSYGKAKLIGKSLLLFERMKKSGCKPDGTVYRVMVHALCNAGKAEIAMEFYKEMVLMNIEVDMNMYRLLLNCLSRSGNIPEVRLIGEDMMKVAQIPEHKVCSCILRSFCIAKRIREALELLKELKNKAIMLDPENFEILVKGLCRDGKISDALEIVDIMKQNHVCDGRIYGIIINGYLRRNEASKAFEIFGSLKESGLVPTAFTYTELMQYLFRSGEYDRACNLYDEMLENGVQPDIVTMTALVAGLIQNNHVVEALDVFKTMDKRGMKMTYKSYSVVIKELCKVSKTDEALELLNKMKNSKMKVEDEIFQCICFALEKKGNPHKVDEIKQMWRAFTFYGQESCTDPKPPYQMTEAVLEHTDHSQEPKAGKTQQKRVDVQLVQPLQELYSDRDVEDICSILLSPINWSSMQEALKRCTIQFTLELVLEVLHRCQLYGHAALSFFSWVGQQAYYSHTTETYNMAIKISGCAKDFKHMRNLYFEMKRRGCLITPDTWTIMIMQYGRAGLTEIALRNFEEMKVDGCKPNKSTYKYLIVLLCGKKGRKVDEAIKLFHQMMNLGHVPDKELIEIYLNCLCEEGNLSDARSCMASLRKAGFTVPLSNSLVIRSLCRAGRLDEALVLVSEAGESISTLDQYIYGSLVHGFLRAGRVEEALAKVDVMKQRGIAPTVHVHTSLIVHFFKEKQIEKALEIFKKMREEGCEPTIVTYSSLIRGYMNMGMVSHARHVFHRMKLKGPFPDFKTYSMFITCLSDVGMSEEALQLINEMLDSGMFPSTVNFRTVFYGLNREGKQDIARTVLQKKWALMSGRKFNQSGVHSSLSSIS